MSSIKNAYAKYGITGAIVAVIIVSPLDDLLFVYLGSVVVRWIGG